MASAASALDETVREYLVYRGFTNTLKQFELEKKDDKDKGFRVNRIVEYIVQCVTRSDFTNLQTFWVYLNKRFFSRLTHDSLTTVYRLETNILRLFLVHATRQGRQEVVRDFFEKMVDALQDKKEWKDWFALPFSKSPEQHPSFKLYFSKEWADAFFVTLHNFFSTLFACLPLPALLNFEAEQQKMQALSTENHHLQMHLATTRQALADAESTVQRLEAKLAQQEAKLAHQVANQAAGKRSYSTGAHGRSKIAGKGTPWKKTASPKKPIGKTSSLEDKPGATHDGTHDGIEKQTSEPSRLQGDGVKKRELGLHAALSDQNTESDLDLLSPASEISVGDEDSIKPYPGSNGITPFMPISNETYRGHSAPITLCKFSPNGNRIATTDTDGVMRVWEPSTQYTLATLEVKPSLLSLDWAPQSDSLVLVGSGNGTVQLFDCNTLRYHWCINSERQYPKILSIACGTSSSTFAFSASSSTGTPPNFTSYLNRSYGLTSPALPSSRFVSSELSHLQPQTGHLSQQPHEVYPGGLYIYDLKSQKQKCSLPISPNPVAINCMAFNHNSSLLITGASDGMIRLFDVSQQEYLFGWRAHDYSDVFNVQFSSDETSVYSMGCDHRFCQWSINHRTGDIITEFPIHKNACLPTQGQLKGEYYPSIPQGNLFAFEDEDKFVLTCAPDQAIVYQVSEGGQLTKTLSVAGHTSPVTCVDWLHGRRSLSTCITGSLDTTVKITNLLKSE